MGRRIAFLLLLAPGAAWAQQGSQIKVVVSTQTNTTNAANIADCDGSSDATTTWSWSATNSTATNFQLVASVTASCASIASSSTSASSYLLLAFTGSGATTSPPSSILASSLASIAGVSCDGAADTPVNICLLSNVGGTLTVLYSDIFTFQLAIPPQPTITSVNPGDSQLTVNVQTGTSTNEYQAITAVTYTVTCSPSTSTGAGSSSSTGPAGPITVGGLTNGVAYTAVAQPFSQLGNQGPLSATFPAGVDTTPEPFEDFWNIYKNAGGVEQGGCGAGGAGALGAVGVLATFLWLRRRRR